MFVPLALVLAATPAHAVDGPASTVLPRAGLPAAPTVAVEVWAWSTSATGCDYSDECAHGPVGTGGPALEADLPLGHRGALQLRGAWLSVPVVSAFLRARAYGNDAVTVTPWIGGVQGVPRPCSNVSYFTPGMWATGLGVDAGGDTVRVDLSLPVVALVKGDYDPEFLPVDLPALFSEAGIRFIVAPGHSLRLGTASLAPGVSWRSDFGRTGVELAVHGYAHGYVKAVIGRASVSKTF